jgi:hypothetical protein
MRAAASLTPHIGARASERGHGMAQRQCEVRRPMVAWGRRGACTATCAGAQAKYGGAAIGWCQRGRFARPKKVGRVATRVWVRTSVRGLGTGGHRGVPAFAPGRSETRLTRPSTRDVLRGCEPARFNFQWPCSNTNFSKFSN